MEPLSPSHLNQLARQLIESHFGVLWLVGEVSNLARPASGHMYFTLKDSQSQVRCTLWRHRARLLTQAPANGEEVLVRGRLGLYAPRGDIQFDVEHLELAGEGKLRRQFEQTRAEVEARGWFNAEHKRPIPSMPQRLGVVTSPSGAAIRDVLQVLRRRFPSIEVVLYPTRVQGDGAALEIAQALTRAGRRREVDTVLLVRGGGSLEDLMAFNDIIVAEAVFNSTLPVICGVGHEIDTSIADGVADLRAPTPSAAAELAVPDSLALLAQLQQRERQLEQHLRSQMRLLARQQQQLQNRLQAAHPRRRVQVQIQRSDELQMRLLGAMQRHLHQYRQRHSGLAHRLQAAGPAQVLKLAQWRLEQQQRALGGAMHLQLQRLDTRIRMAAHSLDTVSPLATLNRGYGIVYRHGRAQSSVASLKVGETVRTTLADGHFDAEVTAVDTRDAP